MESKVDQTDARVAWSDEQTTKDENISTLWTDFTQNTGFHGVNKLAFGRNYKFRCLWWTLAILCMAAYMSYSITRELLNYYSYPAVTTMKSELVEELTFPAVTICNQSPFNAWKAHTVDPELHDFFKKTSALGFVYGKIDWDKQFLGPTFRESKSREWWDMIALKIQLNFCMMEGASYEPCSTAWKPIWTSHGLCVTFNFNGSDVSKVRLTGGDNNLVLLTDIRQYLYVPGLQSAAGFQVILHEPHVHPDASTSSFLTSPGTTTYAVVKKSTFKYLPRPFKAYGNTTCTDTKSTGFNNSLEFFDTYTYEHCLLECQMKKLRDICGCSTPRDDESLGPICSLHAFYTCYYVEQMKLGMNIEFRKACGCVIPCSFNTYEAKLSTSKYPSNVMGLIFKEIWNITKEHAQDNLLEIRIYYESLIVQSTEQIAQYNTETIIGNLGGQMGICLGASILTLTELGEFLIIVCLAVFRKITHGGEVKKIKPIEQ